MFAARCASMRAQPVLSLTIILMLALGVGASTAIFSVVYGVLLKPLPFPEPERIVQVSGTRLDARLDDGVADRGELLGSPRSESHARRASALLSFTSFSMTGVGEPERLSGGEVTTGFFRSLGVRPVVGRLFEKGEDRAWPRRWLVAAGAPTLDGAIWRRRLNRRNVRSRSTTGPTRSSACRRPASPMLDWRRCSCPSSGGRTRIAAASGTLGVARLKPGVTFEVAQAESLVASRSPSRPSIPPRTRGLGTTLEPSRAWIASRRAPSHAVDSAWRGRIAPPHRLSERDESAPRARERPARATMPCARRSAPSRGDLVRERLTESLIYSVAGTTAGWFLAAGLLRALRAIEAAGIPRFDEIGQNGWALAFAASCALVVGLLSGPGARLAHAHGQHRRGPCGRVRAGRPATVPTITAAERLCHGGSGVGVAAARRRGTAGAKSGRRALGRSWLQDAETRLLLTVSLPCVIQRGAADADQRSGDRLIEGGARRRVGRRHQRATACRAAAWVWASAGADKPDAPNAPIPWATWRVGDPDYFKTMGLPCLRAGSYACRTPLESRGVR